ncbi:DNA-directed RNA polymerase subunit A'/A'' [Candidatus Geothermarchaeota archaeon ex4572_27]|nr:MAG: DNA-directed RNA polymerase subunit A'/A'' [Candidatus Geothermarchaeota archaeon ex4572_27]
MAQREATRYTIESIKFGILSPQMIRKMSVVEVTNPETYDDDGVPITGGVMDKRFGAQEPRQTCPICNNTGMTCPGHFGHIELAEPVVHVLFAEDIYNCLRAVCHSCGRVKIEEERKAKLRRQAEHYKKYRRDVYSLLVKSVISKASKVRECPHCGFVNPKIVFEKPYSFYRVVDEETGALEDLYPNEIREILERIPDEDLILIGFDREVARPEWLIIEVLPVPPLTVRPSTQLESGIRSEDDLTHKLTDIVKVNARLKENKESGSPALIIRDDLNLLQWHISVYFNNDLPGVPAAAHRSGRRLRTLVQRLSGKEGRFRTNLIGKRVDFSARTVISPDSNLSINEVGVPVEVAKELTVPVRVTEHNLEEVKQYVINGPDKHPGANYVIRPDGRRIHLAFVQDRKALAESLKPGYIVERHLKDGDVVLFNRQPSLHRISMMAHVVRVLPGRTFRLHLAVCPPYNADFDGDEMNLHALQNEEAIAEAKMLMLVEKQIISPRYGAPIIGFHRDHITSSYLLTRKDTVLSREEFSNYLTILDMEKAPSWALRDMTGKNLFSLLLPEDFTYSLTAASEIEPQVIVKKGRLIKGVIDVASIGAEKADSILHRLVREYGYKFAGEFITKLTKVLDRYLAFRGFSMGAHDLKLPEEVNERIRRIIEKALRDVDRLIEDYEKGRLTPTKGLSREETLEREINNILSRARDKAGELALKSLDKDNPLYIMTISGARGSSLNVAQLTALLGQQTIRGERISRGYGDRTLPHFRRGDKSALARGFIVGNFFSGLSPTEFFFHCMAGREGLMDTAVRTQQSGYLYRRLVYSLDHLIVDHDFTVKTADGRIVQFLYGEDGVDPARSDHGKPVNVVRLVESISLLYPRGEPADEKFIDGLLEKVKGEIPESLAIELKKVLLEKKANKDVAREAIRQAVIYYKTSTVDPGSAMGVVAAQSIGEPGTQMTLRTFHFAGVREKNVTIGLPRIMEVVDARKQPSTPTMTIYLVGEYAKREELAEKVANKLIETKLRDVVTEASIDIANRALIFALNVEELRKRDMTPEDVLKLFAKKYSASLSGNLLIIRLPNKTVDELKKYKDRFLGRVICGVKGITHATVEKEGDEWVIYTSGSNLKEVLKMPEVDHTRTTTNDIFQIYEVLGIEAARNAIVSELKKTLDEQGLDVDIRHLMLVADMMTRDGVIRQTGRYGIVSTKESVLSRAAFEITVPVLKNAAMRGEEDRLRGVTENLIVGSRVPVGTGLVDIYIQLPRGGNQQGGNANQQS